MIYEPTTESVSKFSESVSKNFTLVACCASVMISATGPAKAKFWRLLGQYDSHMMGPNARTVYMDPREHYLFLSYTGKWSVSSNNNMYQSPHKGDNSHSGFCLFNVIGIQKGRT